ncbi:MAG: alpha-amylase family glycosyl hydrolase, partial [Bacteroidota bacterium]
MRFLLLIAGLLLAVPASAQTPFSWDNATVYFVLPDRFENGDTSNDHAYGRGFDGNGTAYAFDVAGHFHGGDLQGLTDRISQGYFDDLGVNAIWLTAFYEQVHGWVGGGDGSFQHYAYHGYYPLDFTAVDSSMGTASQLEAFVDSAHAHGIRVVLDVVMNHAGYNTLSDMTDYDFGAWQGSESDWFSWRPGPGEGWHDYHGAYVDYTDAAGWAQWWGSDFIRAGLPGYTACGGSDELQCLAGLPDFKTETTTALPAGAAGLPPVLVTKWTAEGRLATELAELDAFYTRTGLTRTPRNHIIKWLTDWVREFGIDGYRVDTAKHVELPAWSALKAEATLALAEWKTNNPTKKVDDLPFWMTAEVFGHGAFRSIYHDNGFDSVINFAFQGQAGDPTSMEPIYSGMAAGINSDPTYNLLSYISSHDTQLFDRGDLIDAGTSLFMLPGGVQVFYGDETARPNGVTPSGDPQQATRSPMNWSAPDAAVLSHWQKLGQFRNRHLAVGAGQHQQITATSASSTPYAFKRTYSSGGTSDQVAVVFNAAGSTTVDVSTLWADGVQLTDAYTGNVATVSAGVVTFSPSTNGVLLIEGPAPIGAIPQIDISSPDLTGGVTFSTDPIDIEIAATDVEDASLTIHYTTDGSAPTTSSPVYTVPFEITSTTTVRALVEDTDGNLATASKTYTIGAGLTVHFKKPASWSAPYVHYFNTDPDVGATTWPGVAMTSEGCDWYSYTIAGTGSAGLVFNANTSP